MKNVVSPSQLQALEDVKRSGDPWARVFGQSRHGGWHQVMQVIHLRKKWICRVGDRWVLTDAGKQVLKASMGAEQKGSVR